MPERRLSQTEFIVMLAMLYATVAFSIDSMLPALPQIADELADGAVNRAQLVLTFFMLGMGAGTLFAGPLSDTFGRKRTITAGIGIYLVGSILATMAPTFELLLLARVLQGVGAAAPRIVGVAMVRDLYEGRMMARITSFVMMIFILFPAVAPAIGTLIIAGFGWRGVFAAFVIFGIMGATWLNLRQGETLPATRRRPFRPANLISGTREILSHRVVVIYTIVITLGFGQMFAMLSSTQQIYDVIFDKADSFPYWFAFGAIIAGSGTFLNATLVLQLGMRKLAMWAYGGQALISIALLAATLLDAIPAGWGFSVYFLWSVSVFFMAGLTFGNLNALALQPLGHIAGLAASVVGAISTVLAMAVAAPIGLAFNGTLVPLLVGTLACSGAAYLLMRTTIEQPERP
ncbi:MAG: multidrug effflux MFS transporter [Paracoccaceae bacterium]